MQPNKRLCFIIAILLVFFTEICHSNEWVPVGEQAQLENTKEVESKLWSYLNSKSKFKFEKKEHYRFQYKYISKSTVLINAICLMAPESDSDPGVYHGPTSEELNKEMYEVSDGGSCFFNVKYNIKSSVFTSLYVNGEA
jgi:hypothetical protein